MRSFSVSKKSLSLFLSVLMMIIIQSIVSTVCLDIIINILLERRAMQIDYLTKIGLINDPSYKVVTYKYILGMKVQYNNLIWIVNSLRLTSIIFLILILMFFIIKRIRKTVKQRFRWNNFIFFSFLISLLSLLHYIPAILEEMAYFDILARSYNRHLLSEGYITENLFSYYFEKKIENLISFKNLMDDIFLWAIIVCIFILAIIYIRRENESKKEIIGKELKLLDIPNKSKI